MKACLVNGNQAYTGYRYRQLHLHRIALCIQMAWPFQNNFKIYNFKSDDASNETEN